MKVGVVHETGSKDVRPAEDGIEGGPQFVREGRKKVVLHLAHPLGCGARGPFTLEQLLSLFGRLFHVVVQTGVVDRDGCLSRDTQNESLGSFGEYAGL